MYAYITYSSQNELTCFARDLGNRIHQKFWVMSKSKFESTPHALYTLRNITGQPGQCTQL